MGTTAEKGAYLNTTKSLLKQKINNLGGSIDEQTTFRQYANQLQTIYDNLPKTSFQEGIEVTIEGGLKGKLDFDTQNGKKIVGYGDTEQDGTPTPSTPIDIECVTGNQDVVVSGKNKLNFSDVTLERHGVTLQIKDNYFILNGTNDGTESSFVISNYMTPFQTNANTKLKAFQISGTATGSIANPLFRTYTNWQNQVNVNFTSSTISDYSEEATYNTSIIAVHGGTFNNYKIGFMVADNLTSGDTYEPYHTPITYPISLGDIELNAIGNYKDELVTDRSTGKWYKHNEIGKYQFTGEESISTQASPQRFGYNIENILNNSNEASNIIVICNYYRGVSFNRRSADVNNTIYAIQNGMVAQSAVWFNTNNFFADKTAFINWLSTNKPTLYYVLATPTLTEITDTTLINQLEAWYNAHSNNGTTIITSNGNLPMVIKVRGLKGE